MAQGRTTGIYFGNLTPIPHDPLLDPPPHACFNCWEKGHTRINCPEKPYEGGFCHNCGRADVVMATCPRCAREYPKWAARQDAKRQAQWQTHQAQENQAASKEPLVQDLISFEDVPPVPVSTIDRHPLDDSNPEIFAPETYVPLVPSKKRTPLLPSQVLLVEAVGKALEADRGNPIRQRNFARGLQMHIATYFPPTAPASKDSEK